MREILPSLRAIVYETGLGVLLLVGPLALAWEAFPGAPLLPEWVQSVGAAVAVPGAILWLWAAVVLVAYGRGTPLPLDPPRRLVVAGPYRWIRNPMHLGLAGVLLGEALLFRSVPVLVFAVAASAALVLWEGPREERELADRFGDRYAVYREGVPAWLPRWENLRRLRRARRPRPAGVARRPEADPAEADPPPWRTM